MGCEIPDDDAYTVGLWIQEGADDGGQYAYNIADKGTGDGEITGAEWVCDCWETFGKN